MADLRGLFRVRSPLRTEARWALAVAPFLIVVAAYSFGSIRRHQENPKDKLMPGAAQIWSGVGEVLEVKRSGDRWLVVDTLVSLRRLGIALAIAVSLSVALGLFMGTFTVVDAFLSPFVRAVSKIPPLALLPILFIYLGVEERPKIALMVIGIAPTLIQDVYLRIQEVPQETVNKAYTLGASTLEVAFRVILAQCWPKILHSIRLVLGPLWVFLIASEAISAESGLGYRIYVVQRQLGVHIILPYILWISALGATMDAAIRAWVKWRHPWAEAA